MATYSSTLVWRIPWTEDPGRLQSTRGCKESDMTEWLTLLLLFTSLAHWLLITMLWGRNCYYLFISCKSRVPNESSHVLAEWWWVLWVEDSKRKCLCEFSGQCSQEQCPLGMNRDRTRQGEKLSCSEIVIKASGCPMERIWSCHGMSLTEPMWQTYEPLHQLAIGCGLPQRGHVISGKTTTLSWQQFSRQVPAMSHQLSVLW